MVKICKKPFIYEQTDRWGVPLGIFSVMFVKGYVDLAFWKELKEFEDYTSAKELNAFLQSESNGVTYQAVAEDAKSFPIMKRLLKRAKGQIWEFDLLVKPGNAETAQYLRTFAVFGQNAIVEKNVELQNVVVGPGVVVKSGVYKNTLLL
jgi:hypothetical protein